ncbi:MAG TPA: hypothetical protein VM733_03650 [Thermoanaerobaculia bacterium]|nr:hypothetical protein [Thermoanaerobaculia bacterium]
MDHAPWYLQLYFLGLIGGGLAILIKGMIDTFRFSRPRDGGGRRHSATGGMSSGDTDSIGFDAGDTSGGGSSDQGGGDSGGGWS